MPEDQQTDASETDAGTQESTTEQAPTGSAMDWEAEAKKWQALSRKTEKDANAARTRLAQIEDSQKSEQQRIADRAAEAERRAVESERSLARYRVAVAKSVPADLVDRLRGDTEEEIAADADKLLALLKAQQQTNGSKPDSSQGTRATGGATADMNTLLRAAAGRG